MDVGEDFFEHKFITRGDPEAIQDFYSTEDFLQILGVFPIALSFVLSGVQWDTSKDNTMTVHNAMEISFTLEEREEETPSGEKVVAFFQKRERFKNFIPFTRFLMWDQVQCYGYHRREDGSSEIFHRGEYINAPLPVRMLVKLHAKYVIWATEKHINSPGFLGKASLDEQHDQRGNIPLYALNDFIQRLIIAQRVAIESGKIAAGQPVDEAQKTLKKLQKLQETPTYAYVNTVRKSNLKRNKSTVEMHDPAQQKAIDAALAQLATTKEGRDAAEAAVKELLKTPEVEKTPPRYGGAFNLKVLKE